MAINFGDTIMEGGIEPSVRVQAPVEAPAPNRSSEVFANAMNPVFGTLGAMAGAMWKNGQDDAKTKILTSYENDLLDIADFVDQGGDRNEAMIRARTLRRGYLAQSPSLQGDFDTVWTDFAGANGLGNVVISGTMEQQADDAKTAEAIKLNYPDRASYDRFLSRGVQAAALSQELDILKSNGGIATQTQLNAATKAVIGLADSAFPAAQTQINKAIADIVANPGNKVAITEQLNLTVGQNIAQLQQMAGPAENSYIVTPIQGLMDTFNKWSTGEIGVTVLENAIKNTQLQYTTMFNTDPILGPIIAQSKLINDLGLANSGLGIQIFTPGAIDRLRQVLDPKATVSLIDNSPDSARFTQNITAIAGQIKPDSDPALVTELMQAINSSVDGVYVHERSATDGAIGFKDTVEMLGSPQVGEVIRQNGGVDAKYSDQFVKVLQDNYEKELVPAITKYWESVPVGNPSSPGTGAGNATNTPMSQLLTPVWNGSAVEFVPTEQYKSNPRIIALAAEVNNGDSSIGKPLNSLINAYANVGGVDAKTIWEQDFAGRLFSLGPDGKPLEAPVADRVTQMLDNQDGQANSDNITLGSFQPDTLEPVEEFASQASVLTNPEQALLPPIDPAYTSVTGVDYDSYLPSIRSAESGGNDSAQNPTSTATGRYQFLKSTWDGLVNKYPNSGLTFDGRMSGEQQEVAIRLFTAENARMLKARDIPLNNGTLYAAHFLGAADAVKVLNASEGMVADFVPSRVVNANRFLKGMTVAQFKAWANRKGNG
jgi:hypothetical protein